MRIITLDDRSMENILADMLKRDPNNYDSYTQTVEAIVNDVRNRRDEAVFEYTAKFDHAYLGRFRYPGDGGGDTGSHGAGGCRAVGRDETVHGEYPQLS